MCIVLLAACLFVASAAASSGVSRHLRQRQAAEARQAEMTERARLVRLPWEQNRRNAAAHACMANTMHAWTPNRLAGDLLWEYAEQHGIADRQFVMVGSDFGLTNTTTTPTAARTTGPSAATWSWIGTSAGRTRVVGEPDAQHFPERINPSTVQRDDADGTIIYPKHVHKALRGYLGIDTTPRSQSIPAKQHGGLRVLRLR